MEIKIGNSDVYAIVSTIGGTVTEFVWNGRQLIYPQRPIGGKSRGGIPICFPFFGKPPEQFSDIQQHGWLRNEELRIISSSFLKVIFQGRNEPTKTYPWRLEYSVDVSIDPVTDLKIKLTTKRLPDGLGPAPINPAFHPYFTSLGDKRVFVDNIEVAKFQQQSSKIYSGEWIFIESGRWRLRMILGGAFDSKSPLTLWSDNAKEYFCVEPVLTDPLLFANSAGGKFLEVGKSSTITCGIKFIYDIA